MNKSKRIQPIIKIAEDREHVAAQQYQKALAMQRDRKAKLDELLAYKDEYQGKFLSVNSVSRSAFQFNDYLAFLHRLDAILVEQQRIVVASDAEVEKRRRIWLKLREKTQSLEKASERFICEERAIQDKKDQKDSDERAQRSRKFNEDFEKL